MSMTSEFEHLLAGLKAQSKTFTDTLEFVQAHFDYTPTGFKNGAVHNPAGTNEGSCKVFGLGQFLDLSAAQTLILFAEHYQSVLATPEGEDHQNIRQFMDNGWSTLLFDAEPLQPKS